MTQPDHPFAPPADSTPRHASAGPPPMIEALDQRPPTGLAVAVIVMGWVWVVWFVVLGFAADASEDVWREAAERELRYSDTGWVPFDLAYLPVRPFVVATFIVVSLWLHQSRRFVQVRGLRYRFRLPIVWTWLGWFVPIVSLWFPVRVVRDTWEATLRRRVAGLLVPWWGCWLLMSWIAWMTETWLGGVARRDVLGEEVRSVGESYIVCAVLAMFGCWAWTVIVMRIRRGQQILQDAQLAPRSPSETD
jgi:hypothetical protein